MDETWSIDHIGHAVKDLESAVQFYTTVLGFVEESRERVESHHVEVVFVQQADTCIELMAPLDGDVKLGKFLSSRGEGLHHICYRVDSVVDELERLSQAGVRLVDSAPRPGARGTEIAFLHPQSAHGVLIELCSYV